MIFNISTLQDAKSSGLSLQLTALITAAQQKRATCYQQLEAKAELELERQVKKFLRAHNFQSAIRKSTLKGENSVEVQFRPKYQLQVDLSSPIIEFRDRAHKVRFFVTYNQFLRSIESVLFEDDAINGEIIFETEDEHGRSRILGVRFEWDVLVPPPLILNLLWDEHVEITELEPDETVGQLIDRLHLEPRDGTALVVRHGQRKVGLNQPVSTYIGATLTVRPAGYREQNGIDVVNL